MKTELKDVIHFYLGCNMKTERDSIFILEPRHFPSNWNDPKMDFWTQSKPILRPLSDMTEEEASYIFDMDCSGIIIDKDMGKTHLLFSIPIDEIMYLLKQGFDLFGLIESGQAIDKTTLKS